MNALYLNKCREGTGRFQLFLIDSKILSLQDPLTGGIETGITTMASEEKDNPT